MVAAAIANIPPNNAGNRRTSAAVSQAEAADLFGVAERSVSDAKAVLQSGDEALKEEVKAGATSVKAAAKKARAAKKKAKGEKPRS